MIPFFLVQFQFSFSFFSDIVFQFSFSSLFFFLKIRNYSGIKLCYIFRIISFYNFIQWEFRICKNRYIFKLKFAKNNTLQNYSVIVLILYILYRNILYQFFRCIMATIFKTIQFQIQKTYICHIFCTRKSDSSRNQIFVYKIYGNCTFSEFET